MEQLSYGWVLYIFDPLIWIHAVVLLFVVGLSDPGIIPRRPDPATTGTRLKISATIYATLKDLDNCRCFGTNGLAFRQPIRRK